VTEAAASWSLVRMQDLLQDPHLQLLIINMSWKLRGWRREILANCHVWLSAALSQLIAIVYAFFLYPSNNLIR